MTSTKFELADETLKQQITDELVWDDRVDVSTVTVSVEDGTVVLGGETSTLLAKNLAETVARMVDGVREVKNEVTVREPLESLSDDEVHGQVSKVLFWNRSLGEEITPTVRGGMVVLDGRVNAYWKLSRAQILVEDLEGVREVVNRLAVVPTGKIRDEQIAKRIMDGLVRSRLLDPDQILVKVERGVVTLGGEAPTTLAKFQARKIAARLPGVVRIVNDIRVKG